MDALLETASTNVSPEESYSNPLPAERQLQYSTVDFSKDCPELEGHSLMTDHLTNYIQEQRSIKSILMLNINI